jgi:hypothetical protein
MSANLRRMVVLGPNGTITPSSSQDYRQLRNREFFAQTSTRWVRMWADWFTLQRQPGPIDPVLLASLDEQIALAKRDGLRVILTLYRFPTWANGTDQLTPQQLADTMPDRRTATQADAQAKQLNFRYPDDVSAGSAWGQFVDFVAGRYSRGNPARPIVDATVDVLEICNEPNLQWWPQQSPNAASPFTSDGNAIVIHNVVARMFATAKTITARYGNEPVLGGPAMADITETNRLRTGYASVMNRLLPALTAAGFTAGPQFAWTHHNYRDVTFDQGAGTTAPDAATVTRTTNSAADTRRRLIAGGWTGWPAGDAANPGIMLTEGGVTLSNIETNWGLTDPTAQRLKQADLIQRSWARMTSPGEGAGIEVTSNYLWYTDPNFDSGLADAAEAGGATRPAYDTWRGLPSFA